MVFAGLLLNRVGVWLISVEALEEVFSKGFEERYLVVMFSMCQQMGSFIPFPTFGYTCPS